MSQRLGASEVIGCVVMTALSQGDRGYGGNITGIHSADLGVANTGKESALPDDRLAKTQKTLHEQIRPQEGMRNPRISDFLLYKRVVAQKTHRRIYIRRPLRQLDDMRGAHTAGDIDKRRLLGLRFSRGTGQQERLVDAVQGPGNGLFVIEITDNRLC